ncbi:MAG TPA: PAS domain-containing sensor histidine kinase, partial [Rhizobiaceae bacterium]|nr:PAS domain-containing sensor histidine kinase [Rhizobiaceae bacterium]
MASTPYSFIDIAVLDEVRTRFVAGEALAILSMDLEEVHWANGQGAALFGYSDIEAVIGASPRLSSAARRQITSIPNFPRIGRDRPVAVRIGGGFKAALVALRASDIELPDGERAILLALPAPAAQQAGERSEKAISGFDEVGHFAALVDAGGEIIASSEGFSKLGITGSTLRQLVEDVRSEPDRLVKRLIPGKTVQLPAGMARLTDDPAMHLLVVVDEEDGEAAAGGAVAGGHAAGERPHMSPDQRREPVPSATTSTKTTHQGDHDRWYFAEEERREAAATGPGRRKEGTAAPIRPMAASVRFIWRTDAETRFTAISEEFVEAVGEAAADVIGRRFREVANAFGLDPRGEISALLERRDTWSGRTVMWPLAGTTLKAPVDLAALPAYSRDRTFEGFRGFGILRIGDAAEDPERIGLALVPGPLTSGPEAEEETAAEEPEALIGPQAQEESKEGPEPTEAEPVSDEKVIHLAQHRQTREVGLSLTEQTAFREIGDRLRRESGVEQIEQGPPAAKGEEAGLPDTAPQPREHEEIRKAEATALAETADISAVETPEEPGEDEAAKLGANEAPPPDERTASPAVPDRAAAVAYLPSAFSGAVRTTA